jgi:hypothetical protein
MQSNVLQLRNDYARHEAFSSLFTLCISRKEEFSVPEITVIGSLIYPLVFPDMHAPWWQHWVLRQVDASRF